MLLIQTLYQNTTYFIKNLLVKILKLTARVIHISTTVCARAFVYIFFWFYRFQSFRFPFSVFSPRSLGCKVPADEKLRKQCRVLQVSEAVRICYYPSLYWHPVLHLVSASILNINISNLDAEK